MQQITNDDQRPAPTWLLTYTTTQPKQDRPLPPLYYKAIHAASRDEAEAQAKEFARASHTSGSPVYLERLWSGAEFRGAMMATAH